MEVVVGGLWLHTFQVSCVPLSLVATYFSGVPSTDCVALILAFRVSMLVMGSFKNTNLPESAAHRTISGLSTLETCMRQMHQTHSHENNVHGYTSLACRPSQYITTSIVICAQFASVLFSTTLPSPSSQCVLLVPTCSVARVSHRYPMKCLQ